MESKCTRKRLLAWTLAGCLASVSVAGADDSPTFGAAVLTLELGDSLLSESAARAARAAAQADQGLANDAPGVWSCGSDQQGEEVTALYFENDLELGVDGLEGQQWVPWDLYRVELLCGETRQALRFLVTLPSGGRVVLAIETLDGEPLEEAAFVSRHSRFRINRLDWGDGDELLALDVDFEAHFDPSFEAYVGAHFGEQSTGHDPVFGRLIWNTSWDPDEPPFVGLTEEEHELGYWGQVTLSECGNSYGVLTEAACREDGTPADPSNSLGFNLAGIALTVDGIDFTTVNGITSFNVEGIDFANVEGITSFATYGMIFSTAGHTAGFGIADSTSGAGTRASSSSGARPQSPRDDEPADSEGTEVDSIRYSNEQAQSPDEARTTVEAEVAQLASPDTPEAYFAGWPALTHGNLPAWQDFETTVERDAETARETRSETDSWTAQEWVDDTGESLPNSSLDPLRAALVRALEEVLASYESAGEATPAAPAIESDASIATATLAAPTLATPSTTPIGGATAAPLFDSMVALETLVRGWLVASVAAMSELLEGASAFWLEVSS